MSLFGRFSKISLTESQFGSDTYYPRHTGRTGNELAEYFFWFFRAKEHGKIFENSYKGKFPYPFDILPIKADFQKYKFLIPTPVPSYPLSSIYYVKHRKDIKLITRNVTFKDSDKIDVVIHVRLDDIMNDMKEYSLLPLSYYKDCLNKIGEFKNIVIVGKPSGGESKFTSDENKQQLKILTDLKLFIEHNWPDKNVSIQTGTLDEDYFTITRARNFIGSTSYFWFWPIFVSECIENLYFPDWGVVKKFHIEKFEHCKTISIKPKIGEKLKYYTQFYDQR